MNIIFPSLCFQCQLPIAKNRIVCDVCALFFDFLEPNGKKIQACFSHLESVASFVSLLQSPENTQYHKAAHAFLCVQFARLNWSLPDCVTAFPKNRVGHILAKRFAKKMAFPYVRKCKKEVSRLLVISDTLQAEISSMAQELRVEIFLLALSDFSSVSNR